MENECILCNQCSFRVEEVIRSISEDYVKKTCDRYLYVCKLTGQEVYAITKLKISWLDETEEEQIHELSEILMSMYKKIEIDDTGRKYICLHHDNLPYRTMQKRLDHCPFKKYDRCKCDRM